MIAAFAAALLAVAFGPHRMGGLDVESDFYGGYASAALSIQHGRIVPPGGTLPAVFGFVGPLHPALLALSGFVVGDLFSAAELISVCASTGILLLWFLLLRRRAGATLGLVVVLLLATNPVLARFGYAATTDATAVALQSAALYVLFARRGDAAAAGAGVLAGLASLTRYTSVYLVPAGLIAIASGASLHAKRGRAALLYGLGCLALTLPWQIYARHHGAEIQFHQLSAFEVYGSGRGINWDDFLQSVWPRFAHAPLAVLTTDPGAVVGRSLFNVVDHLRLDAARLLGWLVAALVAMAPLLALRDRRMLRCAPLALPGIWAYLALVPAAHNERYSLAALPFYLVVAGAAILSSAWPGRRRAPWFRPALVGLVIVVMSVAAVREQIRVLRQQPLETLVCADRLRRLARPGDRVVARKPNLAFHAGVGSVYFPRTDDLGELARHARASRARWLYVSLPEVLMRPQMAFLLDTSGVIPGLTLRAYASVPSRVDRTLEWRREAALYEIGPGFGVAPGWLANDTLRALHTLRGRTSTDPNALLLLTLARLEFSRRNLAGAWAAWRGAARVDPAGMAELVARYNGDTLAAMAQGQSLPGEGGSGVAGGSPAPP